MKKILQLGLTAAVALSLNLGAQALTTTETDTLNTTTDALLEASPQFMAISSSDLLEAGSSSLSSVFVANAATPTTPEPANTAAVATSNAGLNDGLNVTNAYGDSAYYGYNSNPGAKANLIVGDELGNGGTIITFKLNTAVNTLGYNISTIDTIAGWVDHASVANQNYSFSYSTVAAPTVFIPVTTIAYNVSDPSTENTSNGGNGAATEVALTNLGLVGVADLRFDFTPDPASTGTGQSGTGLWLQEIDGFGVATVPEPGAWAMMGLGLAALVVVARVRFARA